MNLNPTLIGAGVLNLVVMTVVVLNLVLTEVGVLNLCCYGVWGFSAAVSESSLNHRRPRNGRRELSGWSLAVKEQSGQGKEGKR